MNPITIKPDAQGKVRDIYDLGDTLLFVATDRISAFDYILEDEIPHKGQVLTQISCFWFELLEGVVENHLVSSDVNDLPEQFKEWSDYLNGRFMIVKKAQMIPIECIVRGYLTGSGFKDYQKTGSVCGIELPSGLQNSAKLPQTLFTPSTKAEIGDHDENISFERAVEIVGEKAATDIRDLSLKVYETAAEHARKQGIIIADTKFEFGIDAEGKVRLMDEVLTPDSSRFWPAEDYEVGTSPKSFDKQFIRDWLETQPWDKTPPAPKVPDDIVEKTADKYREALRRLTGTDIEP